MDKPTYYGKKFKFFFLTALLITASVRADPAALLIDVKVGLMESLSPTEPSSSDRYKRFLESAFYYAVGENEQKLKQCGYKLSTEFSYFEALNGLSPIET